MRKIEIVIQPDCLGSVTEAIRKAEIGLFRASHVGIFDPAAPPEGVFRGVRYGIGRQRVKLERIVRDHEVESAVEAIREGIDASGEGDLLVLTVQDSMRLRPAPSKLARAVR